MKKKYCTPINPKKNSYKEFNNEKKIPLARKFPSPPPNNFSNGPSLTLIHSSACDGYIVINDSLICDYLAVLTQTTYADQEPKTHINTY